MQLALVGLLQPGALLRLLRLQGLGLLLVLALQVGAGGPGALGRGRRRGRPLDDPGLEDRQLVAAHLAAARRRRGGVDRSHLQARHSPAGHLLDVLHRLTDLGNTIIIIEHNLDVIRNADWIIDLGPEGGEDGGRIVAQGPPEQVARNKKSYTGQALAQSFGRNAEKNLSTA